MTTREFITANFGVDGKEKWCSSVLKDSIGDIYSYGYHYPLLFKVGNKVIRNTRGYSNTTQRHIMWSRDVEAIDIHTLASFRLTGNNDEIMERLVFGQKRYIDSIKEQMDSKKRKDTQVYKWLEFDYNKAKDNLAKLMA